MQERAAEVHRGDASPRPWERSPQYTGAVAFPQDPTATRGGPGLGTSLVTYYSEGQAREGRLGSSHEPAATEWDETAWAWHWGGGMNVGWGRCAVTGVG